MNALEWRDIHISDPIGSRRKDRGRAVRVWLLGHGRLLTAAVALGLVLAGVVEVAR